jgi:hypothetical protein
VLTFASFIPGCPVRKVPRVAARKVHQTKPGQLGEQVSGLQAKMDDTFVGLNRSTLNFLTKINQLVKKYKVTE